MVMCCKHADYCSQRQDRFDTTWLPNFISDRKETTANTSPCSHLWEQLCMSGLHAGFDRGHDYDDIDPTACSLTLITGTGEDTG